eukprot:465105_1
MCWESKPKFRPVTYAQTYGTNKSLPPKTTLMAIFLLIFGICFLLTGFITWLELGTYAAIPFWTLGGVTFIPGSYASTIIFCTWMGQRGYRYDLIPSYDE